MASCHLRLLLLACGAATHALTHALTHSLRRPTGHPRFTDADLPTGDALAEVTYALYKPRGVLSAVTTEARPHNAHYTSVKVDSRRRTLTDLMVDAGVAPLPSHVGRLDVETSGLMLVTSHSLLLRALLN